MKTAHSSGKAVRLLCALTALLCGLTMTGCGKTKVETEASVSTLKPVADDYPAPTDDSMLEYDTLVNLYLPFRDGQKLLAVQTELTLTHGESNIEPVVQALLSDEGNEMVRSLGGRTTLQLSSASPIECSGDVCTVNLTSSTRALEDNEIYTLGLSLASTLSDVSGIRYVNIMVEDQALPFDVAGNLPAGCFTAHNGEELADLWKQMTSRKTPLGDDPATVPLSTTATLYFPLADGAGIIAEARNLTIAGQTPEQLASGLLSAMSAGSQYHTGTTAMPDIASLLDLSPEVTELPGRGRMITLYFSGDLDRQLESLGIDKACFVASLTWTLTTFIPSVGAVRIYVGSAMMTEVSGETTGQIKFANGMIYRRNFRGLLREKASMYAIRENRLTRVDRYVSDTDACSPRTLLTLMIRGVTASEAEDGLSPALPSGMNGTDILGVGIADGVLLLNLSPRFEQRLRQMDEAAQRLCCYAMVDTVCESIGVARVRFYWNGEMKERLGTGFCWAGEFMLNHSIVD